MALHCFSYSTKAAMRPTQATSGPQIKMPATIHAAGGKKGAKNINTMSPTKRHITNPKRNPFRGKSAHKQKRGIRPWSPYGTITLLCIVREV